MIAAFAVMVSHSYTLATGDRTLELFKNFLGISLGAMAVIY